MILGLTHNSTGNAMQRLPVITKVSIGLAPDKSVGRNYPGRLDHFQFLKKILDANGDPKWIVDDEVTKAMVAAYGENPREIGIVLLNDDIDAVFPSCLAYWKATEWYCKGMLVQVEDSPVKFEMRAIRKTEKHPEGEPWPGKYKYTAGEKKGQNVEACGDGCPDFESGKCKVSGDLYFLLEQFPSLGGVCRIHTSSFSSVANISNALQQIQGILGGRLTGIKVNLRVVPEKVKYDDEKTGTKKSSTAHILSLNLAAPTLKALVEKMTDFARLTESTRKLLGGRTIQVEEDDDDPDRAKEIGAEFYPEQEAEPEAEAEPGPEELALKEEIKKLCTDLGFNQARTDMLLGQFQGKLEELKGKLLKQRSELSSQPEAKPEAKTEAKAETKSGNGKAEPAESKSEKKTGKGKGGKSSSFDF